MKHVVFAIALAGISAVAASGTSIAAPIAPLPAAVTENTGQVIQAHYYHHHHGHHHYSHHRHWYHHHWH